MTTEQQTPALRRQLELFAAAARLCLRDFEDDPSRSDGAPYAEISWGDARALMHALETAGMSL